jgi:hypothetical protein
VPPPAAAFTAAAQQHGLNQWTAPGVGEGFVTSSLTSGALNSGLGIGFNPPTVTDYAAPLLGVPPVVRTAMTWGSHWGGVVARDGSDVVTLENYARNTEDALQNTDTRYYFQMYQTDPGGLGDTWHQAWTSTPMQPIMGAIAPVPAPHLPPTHEPVSPGARSFTNPITMRVARPIDDWDDIADTLFGAVNVDTIKNDHAQLPGAPAATAHDQVRHILKGLRYANVRLRANNHGDPARITAWNNALTGVIAAPRFVENVQPATRAHQQITALLNM